MKIEKIRRLICTAFLGGTMFMGSSTEAGIVTDRFPLQMYAENRVYSYNSAGASRYAGWADGGTDLIRAVGYQNGWVHVYHPGSGGRTVDRWCKADELFANPGYYNRGVHVNGRQTVYRTSSSGTSFGSVNNEDVIVLAEKNNRAQILYTLDNGQGFKVGWIALSAVGTTGSNRNTNITNPIQVANDYVPINNGWYQISPAHDPNRSLDGLGVQIGNGNNLHMWDTLNVDQQKFYVQNRGNGYFSLQSAYGSKLYVTAEGRNPGANLSMQRWNGSDSQLFRLKNSGKGGYYYIMAKVGANLLFDCAGGGKSNGNNVGLWPRDNENAGWYKWKFTSVSSSGSSNGNVNSGGNSNVANLPSGLLYPLKGNIRVTSSSATLSGTTIKCDYVAAEGTELRAPSDGKVWFIQRYSTRYNALMSYGNYIRFESADGQYKITCAHLSRFNGVNGTITQTLRRQNGRGCGYNDKDPNGGTYGAYQKEKILVDGMDVTKNTLLGWTGMTGNASAPHMHIEVKKNGKYVDPKSVFTTW